jgi:hypothetical protein
MENRRIDYDPTTRIPIGSRVRARRNPNEASWSQATEGEEYIVTGRWHDSWYQVHLRAVKPTDSWDGPFFAPHHHVDYLDVLELGDGTVKEGSYALYRKERFDKLFRETDHTHQGYTNFPTFLAVEYIWNEPSAHTHLQEMIAQYGKLKGEVVMMYYQGRKRRWKYTGPEITLEDRTPDGFPVLHFESDYRLYVNWNEVADELDQRVRDAYNL